MATAIEGLTEFQGTVERMATTIERLEARGAARSDIYFWKCLKNYYQGCLEASQAGKPLAVTGMFPPHELLRAMDIPYYVAENHAIMSVQNAPETGPKLFEKAEAYGVGADVCSPHRASVGVSLLGQQLRPSFVISTSTTCDQTLMLYEILADFYQVPRYTLDSPFKVDHRGLAYSTQDTMGLISFLEEQTGRKLDMERLKEVLRLSKQCYDHWEKLNQLRKAVPCPIGGRASVKDLTLTVTSVGTPEAVEYFKARYQELSEAVAQKKGAIPDERYRIAWLYVLPLHDLKIADWLETEYGAVICIDTFGYPTRGIDLDPEDPIGYLVKKPLKRGFTCQGYADNQASGFVAELTRLVKEYKANIAIAMAHWSCQQYNGIMRMMKDEVQGKLGVPFFMLNGDLLDARVASSEQMKSDLANFMSSVVGAKPLSS